MLVVPRLQRSNWESISQAFRPGRCLAPGPTGLVLIYDSLSVLTQALKPVRNRMQYRGLLVPPQIGKPRQKVSRAPT
jgi:hypothetical protein